MRLTTILAIVFATTLVSVTGIARAQNLVVNGDFDTNLAGWYYPASFVEDSWSAFDAGGSPSSGSVRQENANTDGVKTSGIGQCVPVVAGESYRVGVSIYVPSGQAATGLAGILFQWMASADCSGAAIGGGLGTDGEWVGFDAWQDWMSDFVEAPPGAQAMEVDLPCRKNTASGTFVAYWDDVSVAPEPGATALAVAGVGALAARSRRRRIGSH